jgi:penicillin-binding protein 2
LGHLLGYLGKTSPEELQKQTNELRTPTDLIGRAGIESFFEKELRGKPEVVTKEVDANGHEVRKLLSAPLEKGNDAVLTLSLDAQTKLEEVLQNHLKLEHKQKAAAIALDPRTGEILALVSLPGFMATDFSSGSREKVQKLFDDPSEPLFNRAISGVYPSGSVIKPILALAALEEHIVTPATKFLSTGGLKLGNSFFPDWKAGGHGWTDLTSALAWSVNTYFYIIGGGLEDRPGLGLALIEKYFGKFFLGKKSGIELPSEAEGFYPIEESLKEKGEHWYTGDTYNLSIGQGKIGVTPLQIALVTSVFANGGTLFKPTLIHSWIGSDGREQIQKPVVLTSSLGSATSLESVRRGLRAAVQYGSAQKLGSLRVPAAGKTGTAQWKKGASPHSWFTAFAPYKNPEIVITVFVEEGGEGSGIALDVAKEFLEWYFSK